MTTRQRFVINPEQRRPVVACGQFGTCSTSDDGGINAGSQQQDEFFVGDSLARWAETKERKRKLCAYPKDDAVNTPRLEKISGGGVTTESFKIGARVKGQEETTTYEWQRIEGSNRQTQRIHSANRDGRIDQIRRTDKSIRRTNRSDGRANRRRIDGPTNNRSTDQLVDWTTTSVARSNVVACQGEDQRKSAGKSEDITKSRWTIVRISDRQDIGSKGYRIGRISDRKDIESGRKSLGVGRIDSSGDQKIVRAFRSSFRSGKESGRSRKEEKRLVNTVISHVCLCTLCRTGVHCS